MSTQIDREQPGPPGIDGYLHIVEIRRDDPRSSEQRLLDRARRTFHVKAALARDHTHHTLSRKMKGHITTVGWVAPFRLQVVAQLMY